MTESHGEVFDLGYQHYEGPREGRLRVYKALWVNGVRTALGLGRGWGSKVLPAGLFVAIIIPALFIGIPPYVASPEDLEGLPGHAGYYQVVSIIVLLFSAIIAPELLCPDRRNRVIDLYLVRPLTTTDYVAGRWLAFLSVTLALLYLAQVVLFIGFVLAAAEPLHYIRDNWLDIPRFLAAGAVVAIFSTTLPMAVSAFTTRRAYAAAFVIGLFIISASIVGGLTECHSEERVEFVQPGEGLTAQCDPLTGNAAKWIALVDFGQAPSRIGDIIFSEEPEFGAAQLISELPTAVIIGWYLLLTIGPGLTLWWRYRRIRV